MAKKLDVSTYSKREADLIYNKVTKQLLDLLKWKTDTSGRKYLKIKYSTYSTVYYYFLLKKDKKSAERTNRHRAKCYLFSDLLKESKYRGHLNKLAYVKLPVKFTELYKANKLDTKRKQLRATLESQRESAKHKARARSLEQRKESSLDFKVNAQRDIARAILSSLFNEKLKGTGLSVGEFSIAKSMSTSKLSEFLVFNKNDKEAKYLIEASERALDEVELSGETLFLSIRKITCGNEQVFLANHLLMSKDNNVRRFAIRFSEDSSSLGLLDEDVIVRAAAEKVLKQVV